MKSNTHINWIDHAKCLGIMIVVYCHTPQNYSTGLAFLYSFQMPLFFLLSGYLHKVPGNFTLSIKKYWNSLILPYILYQLLFYPYWCIVQLHDGVDISTLYKAVLNPILDCMVGKPINGVTWFIVALLIIKLCANYILSLKHKRIGSVILALAAIVARYLLYVENDQVKISFAIDSMLLFLPFFFLGYFLKSLNILTYLSSSKRIYYIGCITAFIISILSINIQHDTLYVYLLKIYLEGVTGSLFLLFLCMILNPIRTKIVSEISSGSILIFALHWMCIGTLNFFIKNRMGIHGEIQYSPIVAVGITLSITFMFYFIIKLCKKKAPVLLGYRK